MSDMPDGERRRRRLRRSGDAPDPVTTSERRALEARQKYQRKHRLLRLGQALMAAGAIVAVVHWLAHVGVFGGQPSGVVDLLAGYPTAALLFVAGAIAASQ